MLTKSEQLKLLQKMNVRYHVGPNRIDVHYPNKQTTYTYNGECLISVTVKQRWRKEITTYYDR